MKFFDKAWGKYRFVRRSILYPDKDGPKNILELDKQPECCAIGYATEIRIDYESCSIHPVAILDVKEDHMGIENWLIEQYECARRHGLRGFALPVDNAGSNPVLNAVKRMDKNDDFEFCLILQPEQDEQILTKVIELHRDRYISENDEPLILRYNTDRVLPQNSEDFHERDIGKMYSKLVSAEITPVLNAWNVGDFPLIPNSAHGFLRLNTVSQALIGDPYNGMHIPRVNLSHPYASKLKVMVQAHIFYPELCSTVKEQINRIPATVDLYISTDTEDKKEKIEKCMSDGCKAEKVCIEIFENRGRDIAPFLIQCSESSGYDLMCHIHTKKSYHIQDRGGEWCRYLYDNLFHNTEYISEILYLFTKHKNLGLLFPPIFEDVKKYINWGDNRENTVNLLKRMGYPNPINIDLPIFPAGSMFWSRPAALKPLFDLHLKQSDFPREKGQNDGTLAHAVERSLPYVTSLSGYTWATYSVNE